MPISIVQEQSQDFMADRPFVTLNFVAPDFYKGKNIGTTPAINVAYGFFKKNSWGEISTSKSVMPGEEFTETHIFSTPTYKN